VRAWFEVFPREDWAYYCFAILLPTLALGITRQLAARYLPPDKRVVGIAPLTFVPFYNFHAIKFNANTVLTPFWALATWWFLRSFETRRIRWAVLAGVAAAAAMLAKYWSITLLAGLGVAALTDPRRNAYFSSPAPYVTLAVGNVLLTPNIYWLTTHAFLPFHYAMEAHSGRLSLVLFSALIFAINSLAYAAAAIVLCALATRPSWAALCDTLRPSEPERRTLVIAFAAPFGFGALIGVLAMAAIESIWEAPAMALLPIVLLSSPLIVISRLAAVRLLALAVAFPLLMLAVSQRVALGLHLNGVAEHSSDYRAVGQAVERVWRAHTDKPLRIVGCTTFVNGIVFYFKDQSSTLVVDNPKLSPWVSVDRIESEGAAIVCPKTDAFCMRALHGYAGYYHVAANESVLVSRRFFDFASPSERYEIIVIPPDGSQSMHSDVGRQLTLHLPRVFIVGWRSRASGGVGVL
jgi:hypothetical protein